MVALVLWEAKKYLYPGRILGVNHKTEMVDVIFENMQYQVNIPLSSTRDILLLVDRIPPLQWVPDLLAKREDTDFYFENPEDDPNDDPELLKDKERIYDRVTGRPVIEVPVGPVLHRKRPHQPAPQNEPEERAPVRHKIG